MGKEKIEHITFDCESDYPSMRYKPSPNVCGYEYTVANSSNDEKNLGPGWYKNPRDFGVKAFPRSESQDEA